MITKKQKIIIVCTFTAVILFFIFLEGGTNPMLHLMYSDNHMLESSMKSDIVQIFNEMYPENTVRYVRVWNQAPAIVFEAIQSEKSAFMAVSNFDGKHIYIMYKCHSPIFDTTYLYLPLVTSPDQLKNNPCFTEQ